MLRRFGGTAQRMLQRGAPQPNRDQPEVSQPTNNTSPLATSNMFGGGYGGTTATSSPPTAAAGTPGGGFRWPGANPGLGGAAPIGAAPKAPGTATSPPTSTPASPSTNAPVGNKGPKGTALEMNPHYQQGLAALDEELRAILAEAGVAEADLEAQLALIKARLGFSHQETLRRTDEAANERGIFNSGIRMRDRGYVDYDFGNRYQDAEIDRVRGLRDIASMKGRAFAGRNKGLSDLALRIAEMLAANPGMDAPTTGDEGLGAQNPPANNGGNKGGAGSGGPSGRKRYPGFGRGGPWRRYGVN